MTAEYIAIAMMILSIAGIVVAIYGLTETAKRK